MTCYQYRFFFDRAAKQEFQAEAQATLANWKAAQAKKAQEKQDRRREFAAETASLIAGVAERVIEYREKADTAKLPVGVFRRLAAQFADGDPSLRIDAGGDVPAAAAAPSADRAAVLVSFGCQISCSQVCLYGLKLLMCLNGSLVL